MPQLIKLQGFQSSDKKTSSAAIRARAGVLGGILVINDGINDPTITLHDNATAASGTELFEYFEDVSVSFGAGGPAQKQHLFRLPDVVFANGCYLTLTGTGAAAIVFTR